MFAKRKAGTTSWKMPPIFLQDSSSSTGAGLTGLVYNTSNLTCYYVRSDGTASVAVSLATATLGTWASGGFVVVDGTHMPGLYQFYPPDAALAAGAEWVEFYIQGATNLAPTPILVVLTATDEQTAAVTLPAIPNNWLTTAGINDGAITDAKITFPAEAAGRPTTFLASMRRVWEWAANKRDRDRTTGNVLLSNAAGNATLETQVQSTSGTTDTISQGA